MKKSFYKISLVLAFTIVMVSCKRNQCHECHYDDATGNEVPLGEKCGDELENLEANGYADTTGSYVVHCHGH
jgi:hypothetical protein